jgi:hypothetical protein
VRYLGFAEKALIVLRFNQRVFDGFVRVDVRVEIKLLTPLL